MHTVRCLCGVWMQPVCCPTPGTCICGMGTVLEHAMRPCLSMARPGCPVVASWLPPLCLGRPWMRVLLPFWVGMVHPIVGAVRTVILIIAEAFPGLFFHASFTIALEWQTPSPNDASWTSSGRSRCLSIYGTAWAMLVSLSCRSVGGRCTALRSDSIDTLDVYRPSRPGNGCPCVPCLVSMRAVSPLGYALTNAALRLIVSTPSIIPMTVSAYYVVMSSHKRCAHVMANTTLAMQWIVVFVWHNISDPLSELT